MEMAKDRYRFILDRPVIGPPTKRWLYSGGATALVGRIIAKGTSQSLPDYARTALFDPLALGRTEWVNNKDTWVAARHGPGDGEPVAASGLRMTPRDLARVGQLVLDSGAAGGQQVLPAQWLTECLTPRVSVDEQRRYGYQWYIGDFDMVRVSSHVSIVGSAASVMVDKDCSSCLTSILSSPSPPGTMARRISGYRRSE
jgi:CubicO group peptidase (beta-lactamase class C family)